MSVSYWLDHSAGKARKDYDAIVIGAGISGWACAYWLKKCDPGLKIAVCEKGELAAGATGRNAGFVTCGSVEHFNRLVDRWGTERALEIWNFSEQNLELLKHEIICSKAKAIQFAQQGSFSLAATASEFEELKKTSELMQKYNIGVEVLKTTDIQQRLGAIQFVGGIKYLSDAQVNPLLLVKAIQQKTDCDYYPNTEVISFEQGSGRVDLRTNRFPMACQILVLSTNAYSPRLSEYFNDKIFPTRGQILLTEPVPAFMEGPCYANFVLDYFRQLPSGEMLIGGFRQLEKLTEVGYSDHVTDKIQNALYDFIQKHLPRLKSKRVTHRWAGVMGFSADGQPLVGALPGHSQVFFSGGFTAHGLGLAFHSGKCLADLVFGRPLPGFISAKRF